MSEDMKILDVEKTVVPDDYGGMGQGTKIGWRVRYLDPNSNMPICMTVSEKDAHHYKTILKKQKKIQRKIRISKKVTEVFFCISAVICVLIAILKIIQVFIN